MSDPDKERTVIHMHYTAWPDHGLPQNAMSLISFIRRVRKEHPVSLDQPLLVHCSAGVGRTGTFILLDRVMQQMKREGTLSIYNILRGMRGQRMKMVQTQVTLQVNIIMVPVVQIVYRCNGKLAVLVINTFADNRLSIYSSMML